MKGLVMRRFVGRAELSTGWRAVAADGRPADLGDPRAEAAPSGTCGLKSGRVQITKRAAAAAVVVLFAALLTVARERGSWKKTAGQVGVLPPPGCTLLRILRAVCRWTRGTRCSWAEGQGLRRACPSAERAVAQRGWDCMQLRI